jgi:hypothetical protein
MMPAGANYMPADGEVMSEGAMAPHETYMPVDGELVTPADGEVVAE